MKHFLILNPLFMCECFWICNSGVKHPSITQTEFYQIHAELNKCLNIEKFIALREIISNSSTNTHSNILDKYRDIFIHII